MVMDWIGNLLVWNSLVGKASLWKRFGLINQLCSNTRLFSEICMHHWFISAKRTEVSVQIVHFFMWWFLLIYFLFSFHLFIKDYYRMIYSVSVIKSLVDLMYEHKVTINTSDYDRIMAAAKTIEIDKWIGTSESNDE